MSLSDQIDKSVSTPVTQHVTGTIKAVREITYDVALDSGQLLYDVSGPADLSSDFRVTLIKTDGHYVITGRYNSGFRDDGVFVV